MHQIPQMNMFNLNMFLAARQVICQYLLVIKTTNNVFKMSHKLVVREEFHPMDKPENEQERTRVKTKQMEEEYSKGKQAAWSSI
ncbi:hypothetical protein JTB14_037222 [Gonioctena quinquepunctata]|nr:hypothetical protein JTB14_037222 [Gonioctena quinquepunctata]